MGVGVGVAVGVGVGLAEAISVSVVPEDWQVRPSDKSDVAQTAVEPAATAVTAVE